MDLRDFNEISRDNSTHPPGGFMGLFNNQSHLSQNSHFVGAPSHYAPFKPNNSGNSSQEVQVLSEQEAIEVDSDTENVRTEKRILWTPEEDKKLMSAWLKNSTDSSVGADRNNEHYWGDVVKSYNMTIPSQRKRNSKQAKDRWHKINRWIDLYECAYLKARRLFTSGYSDQMWIDTADKFYLEDNKKAKLGPFVLKNVWKICRDVAKWKTYNEDLKNARKRKSYRIEGEKDENDDIEEMLERPIGQKAAKKAALAAKMKSKGSNLDNDGKSKESAIDVEKLDKFSKIQEDLNANRMKVLELQQKLSSEKLETTRLAHLTAQETKEAKRLEKESNMMQAYNSLISQDTSSMSDEEKAERVAAMNCLRKSLFPEMS
ncbi:glutathione S-transferase T2-like [Setaria italica]|uniref:glutathione S-transferase T2-like n=1 Tax=Setaria italica TaxID=4555 RepID=UPI000BE55DAF|nr:glutathione S-transferase T2-like [Setaria italica]